MLEETLSFAKYAKAYEAVFSDGEMLLGDYRECPPGRWPFDKKLAKKTISSWWEGCDGCVMAAQNRESFYHAQCVEWATKMVALLEKIVRAAGLRFWDVEPSCESAEEMLATFR